MQSKVYNNSEVCICFYVKCFKQTFIAPIRNFICHLTKKLRVETLTIEYFQKSNSLVKGFC